MSLKGTVWTPIGPSPIDQGAIQANGQVTAIAVNPNNPNIIYIGTAWGGVWRTRDAGNHWTPIFDRAPALGVGEPGAIAIDPVDTSIIYVGTSNRDGSQFSGNATQPPAGLFKSTDGGSSWIRLGSGYPSGPGSNANQFFNQVINVVIVDPANHLTVYLASNSGLYVSTDGGFNWTKATAPFGDVRSLVLDSTSPTGARILYAGITSVGVVRSTDGGRNWTTILNATTSVVATAITAGGFSGLGKVVVALAPPTSPPNPAGIQVLYAAMVGTGLAFIAPDSVGLFQSTNQGGTWTTRATTAVQAIGTSYGGYAFQMAVDPASPGDGTGDIIYYGVIRQSRSTDAGASFVPLTGLHADTHTWGFARQPGPSSIVYCGNDGGIFRCTAGVAFTSINGGGLQTALFYNLDVKPDATASVTVGALQDNGIVTTAGAASPTWKAGAGGDGFDVAHDGQSATQVYGRSNATIFQSTDDGQSYGGISPPFSAGEAQTYLAAVATDPSTSGGVYASSNQNLWQSLTGGASWPKKAAIPGAASEVNVAPANPNNVAVAVGGQVLVSTNAQGAFTLTDITRDLPGQFVSRVAFDPNDPATLYAVLAGFSGFPGGHVFRTTLSASAWTDISPPVDLPFNAIALDGSETPTVLYAGTDFGVLRSIDGGASWGVVDDIHFPGAPVFDLAFHAGELRAATFGRGVFALKKPTGAALALHIEDSLDFGAVCRGPVYQTIEISNVGASDLNIVGVQRLIGSSSFSVKPSPLTPLFLAAGESIEFTVAYTPSGTGSVESATIRITTNDPNAPTVDLRVTGSQATAKLATALTGQGAFGDVCLGSFRDEELTLNNTGTCPLRVTGMTLSPPTDFLAPLVTSYPLVINPGDSLDVILRFRPTSLLAHAATLTLFSNDPSGPQTLSLTGFAPAPRLALVQPDNGNFGNVCVGAFRDLDLVLNNAGKCSLSIANVSSGSPEFVPPKVLGYPLVIGGGDSLELPIRFQPTSIGTKTATITIDSDDPLGAKTMTVTGYAPAGKLAVTGSTSFGGVTACCCADRTLSICNVGECELHVSSVAFKRKSSHWTLLHNPFPATLHPGSHLDLTIRYKATEKCPRSCELVITSDDPETPVRILEVLAYTIWDRCGCAKCCGDCGKGSCEKDHAENCCSQGYPCCDDDDDDDGQ